MSIDLVWGRGTRSPDRRSAGGTYPAEVVTG